MYYYALYMNSATNVEDYRDQNREPRAGRQVQLGIPIWTHSSCRIPRTGPPTHSRENLKDCEFDVIKKGSLGPPPPVCGLRWTASVQGNSSHFYEATMYYYALYMNSATNVEDYRDENREPRASRQVQLGIPIWAHSSCRLQCTGPPTHSRENLKDCEFDVIQKGSLGPLRPVCGLRWTASVQGNYSHFYEATMYYYALYMNSATNVEDYRDQNREPRASRQVQLGIPIWAHSSCRLPRTGPPTHSRENFKDCEFDVIQKGSLGPLRPVCGLRWTASVQGNFSHFYEATMYYYALYMNSATNVEDYRDQNREPRASRQVQLGIPIWAHSSCRLPRTGPPTHSRENLKDCEFDVIQKGSLGPLRPVCGLRWTASVQGNYSHFYEATMYYYALYMNSATNVEDYRDQNREPRASRQVQLGIPIWAHSSCRLPRTGPPTHSRENLN